MWISSRTLAGRRWWMGGTRRRMGGEGGGAAAVGFTVKRLWWSGEKPYLHKDWFVFFSSTYSVVSRLQVFDCLLLVSVHCAIYRWYNIVLLLLFCSICAILHCFLSILLISYQRCLQPVFLYFIHSLFSHVKRSFYTGMKVFSYYCIFMLPYFLGRILYFRFFVSIKKYIKIKESIFSKSYSLIRIPITNPQK